VLLDGVVVEVALLPPELALLPLLWLPLPLWLLPLVAEPPDPVDPDPEPEPDPEPLPPPDCAEATPKDSANTDIVNHLCFICELLWTVFAVVCKVAFCFCEH
jgi:hypothetical protein